MYDARVYNVMIASPGDVKEERQAVRDAIAKWNDLHSRDKGVVLLPLGWETHAHPAMGGHPQAIINKQVLAQADALVVVFGSQLGSPTSEYASGTVEELEEAMKAGRDVLVYFFSGDIKQDHFDPEQFAKLKEFKSELKDKGLYGEFDSPSALHDKVRDNLTLLVSSKLGNLRPPDFLELSPGAPSELSDEAKRLLKTAADGDGEILKIAHLGGYQIRVGGHAVLSPKRGKEVAYWEGAINELEEAELLEAKGFKDQVFRLTREGYEHAAAQLGDEWLLTPE